MEEELEENNIHQKDGEDAGDKRRTNWGDSIAKVFIPGVPQIIPSKLTEEEFNALLLRVRIEEITYKLTSGYPLNLDYPDERSPSPPPIYDQFGKRTNTREQRRKEKLMRERQDLIQRVQKQYPVFKPPADYKPMAIKKSKKIYIPNSKYPEYNFIGLIIGPRGYTQKQMEKESGAKIAIRGKGSFKDGKGRMDGKMNLGDDEDLHVLITADSDESILKAESMVNKLLVPVEEGKNEHKREQLRKLAEINGTLRDNNWKGMDGLGLPSDGISCSHCGEASHPTRDCPMKNQPGSKIDTEYQNLLAAIGGETKEESHDDFREAYDELLTIINKVSGGDRFNDHHWGNSDMDPQYQHFNQNMYMQEPNNNWRPPPSYPAPIGNWPPNPYGGYYGAPAPLHY